MRDSVDESWDEIGDDNQHNKMVIATMNSSSSTEGNGSFVDISLAYAFCINNTNE